MKNKELIKALSDLDPEAEVYIYADHSQSYEEVSCAQDDLLINPKDTEDYTSKEDIEKMDEEDKSDWLKFCKESIVIYGN